MPQIESIRDETVAVVILNRKALIISGLVNSSARFIDPDIKINPING
jgi:hypothetical protein